MQSGDMTASVTEELARFISGFERKGGPPSGDFHRARELQHKVSHLYNIIKVGYPSTIKAAMEIMGMPAGDTRKPITPLGAEAKALLRQKLTEMGILDEEPHGW
jgi:4-hydroxy-tetrahydrodipicolinate synthase